MAISHLLQSIFLRPFFAFLVSILSLLLFLPLYCSFLKNFGRPWKVRSACPTNMNVLAWDYVMILLIRTYDKSESKLSVKAVMLFFLLYVLVFLSL